MSAPPQKKNCQKIGHAYPPRKALGPHTNNSQALPLIQMEIYSFIAFSYRY